MSVERRMYRIQGFMAISARHAAYQRSLEALACEVEDLLGVLRAIDDPGTHFVVPRLERMLEQVFRASDATGQEPSAAVGDASKGDE